MLNKTIRVSEEVHELLNRLSTKNDSYNDVIMKLIENNEEFTDKQAEFYNNEIEKLRMKFMKMLGDKFIWSWSKSS